MNENEVVETKICKHCQSEIPKKAKVCPNCRKKQGGKAKWIVIVIVVIVILCALFGGGDEQTDTNTASKSGEVATSDNANKEDAEKTDTTEAVKNDFLVGDIVETDSLKISYISAQEYEFNDGFTKPKDGNVFYRMEFEFENIGDSDQSISSLINWGCYADGYAVDQCYSGDDGIDATLSPGKKAKGAVYYEVPADAKEITLEYETNFWSEDKIIFIVK